METPEICAGGLVLRPVLHTALHTGEDGVEVALADERDRNTGKVNVRLPKGHVEAGEALEQAAVREVAEEVGLSARILAPLGSVSYGYFEASETRRIEKTVHFYLMRWEDGDGHPADGEMTAVHWSPIEAAADLLTFDTEREIVRRAIALLASEHGPGL